MNLYELPIHTLHQKRIEKEITTTEIVQSVFDRIQSTEEQLNSYLYLAGEEVIEKAKLVDQRLMKGETIHPLEGMPIAIKDIFSTKGIRTTCASRFLKNYIPPYESTVTQRLKDAGYIMIGKTNMDEFAMGSSSENSAFKVTRNPWNLNHVPGGSSGGSASTVAGGQALASLGTDTGGSIRQPAAFSGIVGLKPTYGRVSRWGMVAFASSLDQAGPMTKDVEDAALMLETIAGFDNKDATSLQADVPKYTEQLKKPIKGMKVGVIKELSLEGCDEDVIKIYEQNLQILKDAGAEIVEISIPNISHAIATYYIIAPSEASSNLGRYDGVRYGYRSESSKNLLSMYEESREEGFGKEVKLRILLGTFALSAGYYDAYYIKAQKIQNLIRNQYSEAFKQVDVIASPTTPSPAFAVGSMIDDPLKMYLNDIFTISANLAGIPGISVPGGFTSDNLPVGFQLLADRLQEGKLLQVADHFENALNLEKKPLAI